jgi:hypothetical protein
LGQRAGGRLACQAARPVRLACWSGSAPLFGPRFRGDHRPIELSDFAAQQNRGVANSSYAAYTWVLR